MLNGIILQMEKSMQLYILMIGMFLKYHVSCGAVVVIVPIYTMKGHFQLKLPNVSSGAPSSG